MLKQWFKNLVPFGTSVHTCWQHGCISAARSSSACCLVSRRSQSNERPPDSGVLLTAVSMSTPTPGGGYQGRLRACSSLPGFGDLCVFLRVQGQVVWESPKWKWLGHEDRRYERVEMAANPGFCGGQQQVEARYHEVGPGPCHCARAWEGHRAWMGRGFRSPTDPGQTGGSWRKGHGLGSRVVAQSVDPGAGLLGGGSFATSRGNQGLSFDLCPSCLSCKVHLLEETIL